jgi:hypothetical protein
MATMLKIRILIAAWSWTVLTFLSPVSAADRLEGSAGLYVLGVYEGHTHKYGTVTVFVGAQDHPIVLLLTAYESVDWQIEIEPGAQVAKVILNGYHEQQTSGLPSHIPIERTSFDQRSPAYMYGYDTGSCFRLVAKAEQLYGLRPRQHLCQYRGTAFVVDHNGIRPLPVQ